MKERFVLNNDVDRALAGNRAIVALETTVVTHGLPHPQGVEAALLLEDDVREGGAVPATIGVWGGEIHVGITRAELESLAAAKDVTKLNLSNFAATLAARNLRVRALSRRHHTLEDVFLAATRRSWDAVAPPVSPSPKPGAKAEA